MPAPTAAWMPISELSRRVGVSCDTLRAWERRYGLLKPSRTAGNARRYSPVDEARVRLMKRHLDDLVPAAQAAELAAAAVFNIRSGRATNVPERESVRAAVELRDSLDRFDETSAERALEELFAAYSPTTVIADVLLPYLHEVGERWAANHVTVAQEHFASNFLHARLMALARGWDRGLGPRAVLACAPGEQHTFGLIAFGIALHQLGWRITYLGAATPVEMLIPTAEQIHPRQILVAASACADLGREVGALREVAGRWPLGLAGPGASGELAAAAGATYVDEDPIGAAEAVATAGASPRRPRER
jgi:MerR family transcriptional regulator, light-induced transcriptional regulator